MAAARRPPPGPATARPSRQAITTATIAKSAAGRRTANSFRPSAMAEARTRASKIGIALPGVTSQRPSRMPSASQASSSQTERRPRSPRRRTAASATMARPGRSRSRAKARLVAPPALGCQKSAPPLRRARRGLEPAHGPRARRDDARSSPARARASAARSRPRSRPRARASRSARAARRRSRAAEADAARDAAPRWWRWRPTSAPTRASKRCGRRTRRRSAAPTSW